MNEDARETGKEIARSMLGDDYVAAAEGLGRSNRFVKDMADMAFRNVYAEYWARPGLDRRARSIATLAMLIGLGRFEQLRYHVRSAIVHGVTAREIEEIVLHSCAYAGYPAASNAGGICGDELRLAGLLDESQSFSDAQGKA